MRFSEIEDIETKDSKGSKISESPSLLHMQEGDVSPALAREPEGEADIDDDVDVGEEEEVLDRKADLHVLQMELKGIG